MSSGEPDWFYKQFSENRGVSELDRYQYEGMIAELQEDNHTLRLHAEEERLNNLKEELLRNKNPSLQDAWEKYQALLKLVREE